MLHNLIRLFLRHYFSTEPIDMNTNYSSYPAVLYSLSLLWVFILLIGEQMILLSRFNTFISLQ